MKRLSWILLCAILLLTLSSCDTEQQHTKNFFLMDTLITVTLYTTDGAQAEAVFDECRVILTFLESLWDRRNPSSEIYLFNVSQKGIDTMDPQTVSLLQTALELSATTEGAFDITVAPLVDLWELCEQAQRLPTDAELREILASVGAKNLALSNKSLQKTNPNIQIDLGGIGKGAAIEILIDYLESTGIMGGLVSFGSNVAVFGEKLDGSDFCIALRDPKDETATVGTLSLTGGKILSVSGDYERYVTVNGVNYHHIIDPKTGYPSDSGLSSVAVISSDGAVADALSTALFVMGQERAMELYYAKNYDFEAIFISSEGVVTVTDGLKNSFTH